MGVFGNNCFFGLALIRDLSNHIDFPLLNLPILESYHSDMMIKLGDDCCCHKEVAVGNKSL